MMYEDRYGNVLFPEDVEAMEPWEVRARGIHVSEIYQ